MVENNFVRLKFWDKLILLLYFNYYLLKYYYYIFIIIHIMFLTNNTSVDQCVYIYYNIAQNHIFEINIPINM